MTKDEVLSAMMRFAPGAQWEIKSSANTNSVSYSDIVWKDLFYEKPSEETLSILIQQSDATSNSQYIFERRNAYPKIEDQIDYIFHNGIDKWKERIQNIKNAYPKPSANNS